jgi:predicted ABC-type ATPase
LSSTNRSLRLRIFAGPNGSGKSTIIQAVKNYKVKEVPVDFGIYINADDIAVALRDNKFSFDKYKVKVKDQDFVKIVLASGLINEKFPESTFKKSYKIVNNKIELLDKKSDERLAQILADFLRKKLLSERKKISFETVFSHPSKLEIMKEAAAMGYKVYLYFVSTEDPEINKFRVKIRAQQGGHDVPPNLIESRYFRSLALLYEAAQ